MPDIVIQTNRGTADWRPVRGPRGPQGVTGPGADVTGAEIEAARDEAQAAQTAAEAARATAESAAAAAEAGGTSTDAVMANRLADPASQSRAALDVVLTTSDKLPRMPGPLGYFHASLVADPANTRVWAGIDSNKAPDTRASVFFHRLRLHTRQGEALQGMATGDMFTDGASANTARLTSATANFTAADVGLGIYGGKIPAGTMIVERLSATEVRTNNTIPTGANQTFWIGRTLVAGGNNGRPLADWFNNPSMGFPAMTYNRDRLVAFNPHLAIVELPTNTPRTGGWGTTEQAFFDNGRAAVTPFIEWLRANIDGDILIVAPATYLAANVGDVGHPDPFNYITDAQGNINPPGLAQIYSNGMARLAQSYIGQWPNVDVFDTTKVFGRTSYDTHSLMHDQIHPSGSTTSDLNGITPVGGGYVASADAIAEHIGFERDTFVPEGSRKTRTEGLVYAAPAAGQVRIMSRRASDQPFDQAPVFVGDQLFVSGVTFPFTIPTAGPALVDRISGPDTFLQLTGLTGSDGNAFDFTPYVGRPVALVSNRKRTTRRQISVPAGSGTNMVVGANSEVSYDVTVPGAYPGHQGRATFVGYSAGGQFLAQNSVEVVYVQAVGQDTVRIRVRNKTAATVTINQETWTFEIRG